MVVKIDILLLCNLKCMVCVYVELDGWQWLVSQDFCGYQCMIVDQYCCIINEIKGKVLVVLFYYLGDLFVYLDFEEMCWIVCDVGLNIYININFSFNYSDVKICSLVQCGIMYFIVCVDGFMQEIYS